MKSSLIIFLALTASLSVADTINVKVGPGLTFAPDSVSGSSGDVVVFSFANTYHDVTQGSFDLGCSPSGSKAVYSGRPDSEDEVFKLTLNGTDAIYIYSSQQGDCQGGMVMVINGPTTGDETLYDYRQVASQTTYSDQPNNVQGGVWASVSSSGASGSSTTLSGTASSTESATGSSSPSSTSNVAPPTGGWTKTGMTVAGVAAGLVAFLL